jgi:hypothetical protein
VAAMLIQARGKASEDITNKSRRILNLVGRRLKVSLASRLGPPLSGRLGVSSAPGQAYRSRWAEGHVCDKARRMRYTSTPFAFTLRDETGIRVRVSASNFPYTYSMIGDKILLSLHRHQL